MTRNTGGRKTATLPCYSLTTFLFLVLLCLSVEPFATTIVQVSGSSCYPNGLDLSSLDGTNGFAVNGEALSDESGRSVSNAGDVNGDGVHDIIIGTPYASPDFYTPQGTTYVVFGKNTAESTTFPSELNLTSLDGTNGFAINSVDFGDESGFSVSYAGDVNGDNIADIIIGAWGADPNGKTYAGTSYVVFGKNTAESGNFPAELDFSSLDGTIGFAINGEAGGDSSGFSVSYAGDVNGDDVDDIIIGAYIADPNGNRNAGTSYIVFGKNTPESTSFPSVLELSSLNGTNGFAIHGEAAFDHSGVSVSYAGDLNGDSIADIIIGAPYAAPNGISQAGTSYVVFGKNTAESTSFPAELNLTSLDGTNGFAINGEAEDDYSGVSVSYAGDVNGDGIGDIIIGAPLKGTTYVVFGRNTAASASFPSVLELSSLNGTNGFAISGEADGDWSGHSVSYAGDVNDDSIDDVIIGARYATTLYVVFGKNTSESASFPSELELSSLDGTNGFAINGEGGGDNSGIKVSYAGDVNDDNIADIIIGAYKADPNGNSDAGKSYVVFGIDCTKSPTTAPTKSPTTAPSQSPTTAPTQSPTQSPTRYPLVLLESPPVIEASIAYPLSVDVTARLMNNHQNRNIEVRVVGAESGVQHDDADLQLPEWMDAIEGGWLFVSAGAEENLKLTLNTDKLKPGTGDVQELVYFQWRFDDDDPEAVVDAYPEVEPLDVSLKIVTVAVNPSALNLEIELEAPDTNPGSEIDNAGPIVESPISILNFACNTVVRWHANFTCIEDPGNTDCGWFNFTGDIEGVIQPSDTIPTQLQVRIAAGHSLPPPPDTLTVRSSNGLVSHVEGQAPYKVQIDLLLEISDEGDSANATTTNIPVPVEVRPFAPCSPGTSSATGNTRGAAACAPCSKDQYQDSYGFTACFPCPESNPVTARSGSTSLEDCVEAPGKFRDAAGNVQDCPPGANCTVNDIGLSVATLPIARGHWRAGNQSLDIRECPHPEFCVGGTASANRKGDGYCAENHEGVFCISCVSPYSKRRFNNTCIKCDEDLQREDRNGFAATAFAMIILEILIISIGTFIWRLYKNNQEQAYKAPATNTGNQEHGHQIANEKNSKVEPEWCGDGKETQTGVPSQGTGLLSTHAKPSLDEFRDTEAGYDTSDPSFAHSLSKNSTVASSSSSPAGASRSRRRASGRNDPYNETKRRNMVESTTTDTASAPAKPTLKGAVALTSSGGNSAAVLSSQSRLLIGFFQVTDSIGRNFPLDFPSAWTNAMETIGTVLALDILGFLDVGCANPEIGGSHYMKLIGAIAGPVIGILFAVFATIPGEFAAECWRQFKQQQQSAQSLDNHSFFSRVYNAIVRTRHTITLRSRTYEWFALLHIALLFLIYPFVSLTILQMFSCETFDNGESALIADYSIDCNSDTYKKYRILAIIGVIFYPAGVLIYFASIFAANRHHLEEAITRDTRIRILARGYRPGQYHYELVEMIRKLLQTSVVVFILPGGVTQIFSQSLITMAAIGFLLRSRPYVHGHDYFLAVFVQASLLLISNIAVLNRLDSDELESTRTGFNLQGLLDWLLVLATVLPVLLCFGIITVSLCGKKLSRTAVNVAAVVVTVMAILSLIGYIQATGAYSECASGCDTCVAGEATAAARCQQRLDQLEHCGRCGNHCGEVFPNANGECEMVEGEGLFQCPGIENSGDASTNGQFAFECKMTDCHDGFQDLNGDSSDGCESTA